MEQNRLRELENMCIQDCAPPCTALCPVHVDIRQMVLFLTAGDFSGGYKTFCKSVPFPEIIARTCDQPCQSRCHREGLGGAIGVADLERACVENTADPFPRIPILPRKTSRVAVVGGGLSGLTAAFELSRKGYQVELFEQQDHLGGKLWQFSDTELPRDVLEKETGLVAQTGVTVRLGQEIDASHEIWDGMDAIYLGVGQFDEAVSFLDPDQVGRVRVDSQTFQTLQPKVFAGGSLLHAYSPVLSISDGRRAAISMDRFLQKVSLTASRLNEGAYETRLFTNTAGLAPVEAVPPDPETGIYTKEQAQGEALRCLQCECMECVKVCEYLKHYGSYPKKYVREIYNNMSMLVRARTSNNFINSCALCGLCAEVCPNDLNMGQVNLETRQLMVKTSRMPAATHDFALRDMAFSNGEKFAFARHAPGLDASIYAFFPGCQLSGASPGYVEKAYAFLRDRFCIDNAGVGLILRCCGAPAAWAGREDLFAQAQAAFRNEYEKLGRPKLILACSSCYQVFQKHLPDVEVLSFWEVYNQMGPQQFPGRELPAAVAVHDPCSTRYESHIQDAVRNILQKNGCKIEELPLSREKTECCSFGGLMWLANKAVAEEGVQRRIRASSLDYVTYCAMCREFFARRGKRTLHLLDYIFGEPGTDPASAPAVGFSQNHENRARLKENFLRELWSETMPEKEACESIRLVLPEAALKLVEERLILVEDIQKVIEYAERTGKRLFNPATGHYLAHFKPASVTYWVEYLPQADGAFLVCKAYSHRMEISGGTQNEPVC